MKSLNGMSKKKNNYTPLSSIGEFGLINRIKSNFDLKNSSSILGIGDDAAVIDNKNKTIVSTDMLVENIHFNLMYVPLKHLGYKSVVVNLSDIFAMNAKPEQITVSLSVSNRFTLEAVDELYSGIKLACEKYKVDLIGGDTTSSEKGLIISVTAIGSSEKNIGFLKLCFGCLYLCFERLNLILLYFGCLNLYYRWVNLYFGCVNLKHDSEAASILYPLVCEQLFRLT